MQARAGNLGNQAFADKIVNMLKVAIPLPSGCISASELSG